jgi:hypothetical protein
VFELRHELSILRRQARRPPLREADQGVLGGVESRVAAPDLVGLQSVRERCCAGHQRLVARSWTYPHRRPGRPAVDREVKVLVVCLARKNAASG